MPEFHSELPPMAPPPTLPRQRLRYTRILDVAAGFARKGLDSVVLSEVAARADVPLGTLYRYFPSATQLVLALYRKQLTELHAANSPAAPGAGAGAGAGTGTSGESTVSGVPEQRLSLRVLYGTETNKAKGMWWLMHSHALFVGARALERSWCDSLHLPRCSTSARRAASAGSVCDECERRSLRCLCRQHGRLRPGVTLLWCACVLLVARPHMIGCGCGYGRNNNSNNQSSACGFKFEIYI